MIESKPIDNNSICQAIINLNRETIVVAAIIKNQSIVNFIVNESIYNDNILIKKDHENNDNNLLRNILSKSSKFIIDISNSNKIKSQYLLLNREELTYLIIPLTLNDSFMCL